MNEGTNFEEYYNLSYNVERENPIKFLVVSIKKPTTNFLPSNNKNSQTDKQQEKDDAVFPQKPFLRPSIRSMRSGNVMRRL